MPLYNYGITLISLPYDNKNRLINIIMCYSVQHFIYCRGLGVCYSYNCILHIVCIEVSCFYFVFLLPFFCFNFSFNQFSILFLYICVYLNIGLYYVDPMNDYKSYVSLFVQKPGL